MRVLAFGATKSIVRKITPKQAKALKEQGFSLEKKSGGQTQITGDKNALKGLNLDAKA